MATGPIEVVQKTKKNFLIIQETHTPWSSWTLTVALVPVSFSEKRPFLLFSAFASAASNASYWEELKNALRLSVRSSQNVYCVSRKTKKKKRKKNCTNHNKRNTFAMTRLSTLVPTGCHHHCGNVQPSLDHEKQVLQQHSILPRLQCSKFSPEIGPI